MSVIFEWRLWLGGYARHWRPRYCSRTVYASGKCAIWTEVAGFGAWDIDLEGDSRVPLCSQLRLSFQCCSRFPFF